MSIRDPIPDSFVEEAFSNDLRNLLELEVDPPSNTSSNPAALPDTTELLTDLFAIDSSDPSLTFSAIQSNEEEGAAQPEDMEMELAKTTPVDLEYLFTGGQVNAAYPPVAANLNTLFTPSTMKSPLSLGLENAKIPSNPSASPSPPFRAVNNGNNHQGNFPAGSDFESLQRILSNPLPANMNIHAKPVVQTSKMILSFPRRKVNPTKARVTIQQIPDSFRVFDRVEILYYEKINEAERLCPIKNQPSPEDYQRTLYVRFALKKPERHLPSKQATAAVYEPETCSSAKELVESISHTKIEFNGASNRGSMDFYLRFKGARRVITKALNGSIRKGLPDIYLLASFYRLEQKSSSGMLVLIGSTNEASIPFYRGTKAYPILRKQPAVPAMKSELAPASVTLKGLLEQNGLAHCYPQFQKEEVDLELFLQMDIELMKHLGFQFRDMIKLMNLIKKQKQDAPTVATATNQVFLKELMPTKAFMEECNSEKLWLKGRFDTNVELKVYFNAHEVDVEIPDDELEQRILRSCAIPNVTDVIPKTELLTVIGRAPESEDCVSNVLLLRDYPVEVSMTLAGSPCKIPDPQEFVYLRSRETIASYLKMKERDDFTDSYDPGDDQDNAGSKKRKIHRARRSSRSTTSNGGAGKPTTGFSGFGYQAAGDSYAHGSDSDSDSDPEDCDDSAKVYDWAQIREMLGKESPLLRRLVAVDTKRTILHYFAFDAIDDCEDSSPFRKLLATKTTETEFPSDEFIDWQDKYGCTALHIAVFLQNYDIARDLVQLGNASCTIRDSNGDTVHTLAARLNDSLLQSILTNTEHQAKNVTTEAIQFEYLPQKRSHSVDLKQLQKALYHNLIVSGFLSLVLLIAMSVIALPLIMHVFQPTTLVPPRNVFSEIPTKVPLDPNIITSTNSHSLFVYGLDKIEILPHTFIYEDYTLEFVTKLWNDANVFPRSLIALENGNAQVHELGIELGELQAFDDVLVGMTVPYEFLMEGKQGDHIPLWVRLYSWSNHNLLFRGMVKLPVKTDQFMDNAKEIIDVMMFDNLDDDGDLHYSERVFYVEAIGSDWQERDLWKNRMESLMERRDCLHEDNTVMQNMYTVPQSSLNGAARLVNTQSLKVGHYSSSSSANFGNRRGAKLNIVDVSAKGSTSGVTAGGTGGAHVLSISSGAIASVVMSSKGNSGNGNSPHNEKRRGENGKKGFENEEEDAFGGSGMSDGEATGEKVVRIASDGGAADEEEEEGEDSAASSSSSSSSWIDSSAIALKPNCTVYFVNGANSLVNTELQSMKILAQERKNEVLFVVTMDVEQTDERENFLMQLKTMVGVDDRQVMSVIGRHTQDADWMADADAWYIYTRASSLVGQYL